MPHLQPLELPLIIDRRDLVMHKNFSANNQPTTGVCSFLPCGGSRHRHSPHLPNIKMGNKGSRKCGRSGGASNKFPTQNNTPTQQHQHHQQHQQHKQQHQQQHQYQHHHHQYQHQNQQNSQHNYQTIQSNQYQHQHHNPRKHQHQYKHGRTF